LDQAFDFPGADAVVKSQPMAVLPTSRRRYREVMSAGTEGRCIKKCPDARMLFKDLAAWYLDLPEVKAKRNYKKIKCIAKG
jgi:hypothetical protein